MPKYARAQENALVVTARRREAASIPAPSPVEPESAAPIAPTEATEAEGATTLLNEVLAKVRGEGSVEKEAE